ANYPMGGSAPLPADSARGHIMKSNHKRTKQRANSLRVWMYAEARSVLPYITSVMGSLREHWLAAQGHDQRARRLGNLPGRPDRKRLLATQDETTAANVAKERFEIAAAELHELDVFCTDPIRGEAVIPFVHNDQLAWFIYDLFAPDDLRTWR